MFFRCLHKSTHLLRYLDHLGVSTYCFFLSHSGPPRWNSRTVWHKSLGSSVYTIAKALVSLARQRPWKTHVYESKVRYNIGGSWSVYKSLRRAFLVISSRVIDVPPWLLRGVVKLPILPAGKWYVLEQTAGQVGLHWTIRALNTLEAMHIRY